MRAETALWCALLVILAAGLPVATVGAGGGDGGATTADHRFAPQQTVNSTPADERTVHLDVQLLASGGAKWTVRTHVPLDGPNERESFEELGRKYENGTADVDVDAALFEEYVAAARAESERAMWIDDESVERSWTVEDETGVLQLEFTWTNFAREEGGQLVVDDAFRTRDGTWLPRLEDGQVLVVRPPAGVGFIDAPIRVTNATLRWEGPQQFGPDYFHIEYRSDDGRGPGTVVPPSPGTTDPPTTPPSDTPTDPLPGIEGAMAGVVAVGAVLGYLVLRRRPWDGGAPAGAGDGGVSPSAGAGVGVEDGSAPASSGHDVGTPEDEPLEPTPENPFAGVDLEMLSDEERVIRLLEANGGRMKQARIVKETDWSNAKVSQLLSGMDDDGEIDKLRIGRENLISLPDVEVDRFQG